MPKERPLLIYGRYGALGFEFAGAVLAGIFVGRYADSYLGTEPWFMILGAVGGMAGAIYRLTVVLQQLSRRGRND
jgi:ATP synthase protein I